MMLAGWLVAGVAMAACLYDPAFATLYRVSGRSYRRAVTALTLFGGFASTVFWPLSQYLLETRGWRVAFAVHAALNALPLPSAASAVRPDAVARIDRLTAGGARWRGARRRARRLRLARSGVRAGGISRLRRLGASRRPARRGRPRRTRRRAGRRTHRADAGRRARDGIRASRIGVAARGRHVRIRVARDGAGRVVPRAGYLDIRTGFCAPLWLGQRRDDHRSRHRARRIVRARATTARCSGASRNRSSSSRRSRRSRSLCSSPSTIRIALRCMRWPPAPCWRSSATGWRSAARERPGGTCSVERSSGATVRMKVRRFAGMARRAP